MRQVSKVESFVHSADLPCVWVRDFSFESAQVFCQKMQDLDNNPNVKEIFVYVTSYGGEVYPCLMMVDAMAACSKTVHTVSMGQSASCGSVLFTCGTGTRLIAPNSYVHIHFVRSVAMGDIDSVEGKVERVKELNSRIMRLIADRSKLTKKELVKKVREHGKEWCLTAKEAIAYEFADEIGVPRFKQVTTVSAEF